MRSGVHCLGEYGIASWMNQCVVHATVKALETGGWGAWELSFGTSPPIQSIQWQRKKRRASLNSYGHPVSAIIRASLRFRWLLRLLIFPLIEAGWFCRVEGHPHEGTGRRSSKHAASHNARGAMECLNAWRREAWEKQKVMT